MSRVQEKMNELIENENSFRKPYNSEMVINNLASTGSIVLDLKGSSLEKNIQFEYNPANQLHNTRLRVVSTQKITTINDEGTENENDSGTTNIIAQQTQK